MSQLSAIASASGLDAIAAMAADPQGVAVLKKAMDASSSAAVQLLEALPPVDSSRGSTFDFRA